jgi:hypothetical protein
MSGFNTQGYDLIVEIGQGEVNRQAREQPLTAPYPTTSIQPEGQMVTAILAFRPPKITFDPVDVRAIVIHLPLKFGNSRGVVHTADGITRDFSFTVPIDAKAEISGPTDLSVFVNLMQKTLDEDYTVSYAINDAGTQTTWQVHFIGDLDDLPANGAKVDILIARAELVILPLNKLGLNNQNTGDGARTVFPFTFAVNVPEELDVYIGTEDQVAGKWIWKQMKSNADYAVAGIGVQGGGTITFVNAPGNGQRVSLLKLPIEPIAGLPVYLQGLHAPLAGIITIEGKLAVQDAEWPVGKKVPNHKDIFVVFDESTKVTHNWNGGDENLHLQFGGVLSSNDLDEFIKTVHEGLEEGIKDYLVKTQKLSLTPGLKRDEPKEKKGMEIDPAQTSPMAFQEMDVRAIHDSQEDSLAILIRTCSPAGGTNPTGPMTSARFQGGPPKDVAISFSNWLLLRCQIRQKLIKEMHIFEEDFDDTQPCALAGPVRVCDEETGDLLDITKLSAVIEGDHIRVDGQIDIYALTYHSVAEFTLNIELLIEKAQIAAFNDPDFERRSQKIRDLQKERADLNPCLAVDRTRIKQIKGEIATLEDEIAAIQPRLEQPVIMPKITVVRNDVATYIEPWVVVVIVLSWGIIGIAAAIIGSLAYIVGGVVGFDWAVKTGIGNFLDEIKKGDKGQLLGSAAGGIEIDSVSIDDLSVGATVKLPGSRPGALVMIEYDSTRAKGIRELGEYRPASQREGTDTLVSFYLYNRSAAPVQINQVEVQTTPPGIFSVYTLSAQTINAGSVEVVALRFKPTQAGPIVGEVIVNSNDPVQPQLRIPLVVIVPFWPRGRLKVTPTNLAFTGVVGQVYQQLVEVENVGERDALLQSFNMDNAVPPNQFFYNSTQAITLSPGQKRNLAITYTPIQPGDAQADAVLGAQGDVGYIEYQTILLSATACSPQIRLDPAGLDFGFVPTSGSKALSLTIYNDDPTCTLIISYISIIRGGKAFWLEPAVTFPFEVSPLASRTLQVTYYPGQTPGLTHEEEWEIVSNDYTRSLLRLQLGGAAGGSRIDVLPDFVDFGIVTTATPTMNVTISNQGDAGLRVREIYLETGTAFRLINLPSLPTIVAAGGNLVVSLEFNAATSGEYSDVLVVRSNDSRRSTIRNMIHAIR